MRFRLALLSLSLFVTACSTSSLSPPSPSPALQAAEAKVTAAETALQEQVAHPMPPSRLLTCQDGSQPQVILGQWECPPPNAVVQAILSGTPLEQRAQLAKALRDETNLRFELWQWVQGLSAGSPAYAPAPSPPGS
jgi:hypothetical protein